MLPYNGWIEKRGDSFRAALRRNGRRISATFKRRSLAASWLLDQATEERINLTPVQITDAAHALDILPGGVRLVDAARAYLTLHPIEEKETRAAILADIYLGTKKHLRARTLEGYRQDLNRLCAEEPNFSAWNKDYVQRYLANLTPAKRNHMLATLRAFFAWTVEAGYAHANPLEGVKAVKIDAPRRQVLTIEDARRLLAAAKNTKCVHYLAICMFAGLRPDECLRLRRHHISADYILIDESIAKTHAARTIPLAPNLKAFLSECPLPAGGVSHGLSVSRFRKHMTDLISAAGVVWAADIMRHSYASYLYEETKDAAATAANLGHTTTATMFKHYRGLVPPGTGAQFFTLEIPKK